MKDVDAHWPTDVAEVEVDGERRWVLDADLDALRSAGSGPTGGADDAPTVRLLGPFDLFLQARDRETLVPAAAHRKALWPTLGRPGAVLVDGEVVGTWRPRASGGSLRLQVDRWVPWDPGPRGVRAPQAERLAEHRGATLAPRRRLSTLGGARPRYASTTTGMIIGRRLSRVLTQRPTTRRMTCCSCACPPRRRAGPPPAPR